MPWRKAWVDPDPARWTTPEDLRPALEKRAYEVWISEIMLQQTRVAVVIDYWNRWMERWPTIQRLAAAEPDEVLAAWRGLGYYSRASRIHEAAKLVVSDPKMNGLLPECVAELEAKVPGVGRYTAGAISAIVFGRAAPMVDGNVLRVLSRQLGLFGNIKTNKAVVDAIWAAADSLVQTVAHAPLEGVKTDCTDELISSVSDRPGRWGQALMELGSTVCTPKPNCSECPITSTCRVFGEGMLVANEPERARGVDEAKPVADIEDACQLCEPFEEDSPGDLETKSRTRSSDGINEIIDHAKRFPVKTAKKATREEECLVCALRRSDGRYLIQRRPSKGLLAGMWEFPSETILCEPKKAVGKNTTSSRKRDAESYAAGLVGGSRRPGNRRGQGSVLRHLGELGSVPWQFSHFKLTMHVHLFTLGQGNAKGDLCAGDQPLRRWASEEEIEGESMGTGMRKCWALVRDT